ncbi:flagellar basal body P-ring formation chaperone FlgA [Fulvimonas yonginensis]|uniref:Flagella basal body P-ring formation protein FlgA n=1 Tax=Fulvimonas yonginensis TaxID=1495200 RepID=A0ABU8JE60_9GAMM
MRFLVLLALSLLASTLSAHAAEQTVAAARVVDAARAVLQALPLGADTRLDVQVIGTPVDAVVPAGSLRIQATRPAGQWPRSRIAVPVRLLVAERPVRTETVWFAVKALQPLAVYTADTGQGTPAEAVQIRQAEVDIAQLHGKPVRTLSAMKGQRLRRAMLAGTPVLEEDFEPIPAVDARQQVTVLVRYGAVRMLTRGMALNAGEAGQMVAVLATGADSPVQARVTGKGVVEVAR